MQLFHEGKNLDWPAVHAMLLAQARTGMGRELLQACGPQTRFDDVQALLEKPRRRKRCCSAAVTIPYSRLRMCARWSRVRAPAAYCP